VVDFEKWKAVFDAHGEAQGDTGLRLINMWRCVEEPNNVFFMFEVSSMDKAREFITSPEAAKAGEVSGVVDGECHFIEEAGDS
jgi:hypothetical protein